MAGCTICNEPSTDSEASGNGNTYCNAWHYNNMWGCWEGNPIVSGRVDNVMKVIKKKVSADGAPRNHSAPMSKEYMEQIHVWSNSSCHLNLVMQCAQLEMASGSIVLPPSELLSLEDQPAIMHHLGQIAFFATM